MAIHNDIGKNGESSLLLFLKAKVTLLFAKTGATPIMKLISLPVKGKSCILLK